MREIKFRQFVDGKFWHYWGFIDGAFIGITHNSKTGKWVDSQQFTGLKDKNGKDIYEGDIIHAFTFDLEIKGQVVYSEEMAAFGISLFTIVSFNKFTKIEIIGNIHENPELLK